MKPYLVLMLGKGFIGLRQSRSYKGYKEHSRPRYRQQRKMNITIVKNYLYNLAFQLVRIILPLILIPYSAKFIGESALGVYQYAGSIMNWFILFGILGVNTYGNRQIAKVRDNEKLRNKTFFEIFYMQICNMLIAIAAYYIIIHFAVADNKFYYYLTGLTMIATMLDITWFFYGVEDFKKASIRNTVVKCLSVFLIMLLCKTPEDIWCFILINVGSEIFGQLIMFLQLKHYLKYERVTLREAYKNHFKPAFQLFVPTIAISVYTLFDQTMVGSIYSQEHLVYYNASMGIIKMFLTFITSIGAVMLPRVTNVFYNKADGENKTRSYIDTTMKISMLLALPMSFGMMMISKSFISWYIPQWPSVGKLIQLGCPIVIFISMSNVTGIQFMVPTGMYKQYSISVITGSCINFCINLLLIPSYGALGATIGSVIAEMSVSFLQLLLIYPKLKINFMQKSYFEYAFATVIMSVVVYGVSIIFQDDLFHIFTEIIIGIAIYFLLLIVWREEITRKILLTVIRIFRKDHF